ncbi:MAG TPA: SMI1/KNR4 family protein [Pirellulales bacterium]|nr:SMI1/KNR4 family protein [Pirellulales bacterium]
MKHQVRLASGDRFADRVWGGPELLPADEVVDLSHHFPSWAEGMRPQNPKDARLWDHSLPLVPVGDGDYIGLYVRDDLVDPPVVYLCHEGSGGSDILAAKLDTFLESWENLCYVGIDFVVNFCDPDTGWLAVDKYPAELEALQTLLRGQVRSGLMSTPLVASEQDWLTARNPNRMLNWLEEHGLLDERKLRLYCVACCRRVQNRLTDAGRRAIDVSLRYADGLATAEELAAARLALSNSFVIDSVVYAAVDGRSWISSDISESLDDPDDEREMMAHADLVRHILGNPFRQTMKKTNYSGVVRRLAERLYDGEAVREDLYAALANDGQRELAGHFCADDHPKGCWALDEILGK